MELRDHFKPCEHGYLYEHGYLSQHPTPEGEGPTCLGVGFAYDLCPGGAPVEGKRIEWCKTHDSVIWGPGDDFCVAMSYDDADIGGECKFVPALIVEVDDE